MEPEWGIFLSEDPERGSVGDVFSSQGSIYANSNPTRFTDPTGRFTEGLAGQEAQRECLGRGTCSQAEFDGAAELHRDASETALKWLAKIFGVRAATATTTGVKLFLFGGGLDVAKQTMVDGKSLSDIDPSQTTSAAIATSGVGGALGVGMASSSLLVQSAAQGTGALLLGSGLVIGAGTAAEGLSEDNPSMALFGLAEVGLASVSGRFMGGQKTYPSGEPRRDNLHSAA